MTALIDVLIYLSIIGVAMFIISVLKKESRSPTGIGKSGAVENNSL